MLVSKKHYSFLKHFTYYFRYFYCRKKKESNEIKKRVHTKLFIFLSFYSIDYIYRVKAITRINGVLNEVSSGEVIVTVGTAPATGSFTLCERFLIRVCFDINSLNANAIPWSNTLK